MMEAKSDSMESAGSNDTDDSKSDVDSVRAIRERLLESEILQYNDLDTAEEFALTISPFGPLLRNCVPPTGYVFRGVDNSGHDLVPSAFRSDCAYRQLCPRIHFGEGEQLTDKQQIEFELDVLGRFFRVADLQGLPLPEDSQSVRIILNGLMSQASYVDDVEAGREPWPPNSLLSIMGLAQHHGLPTRLLDWSRNPFKAAYFAAVRSAQNCISNRVNPTDRMAVWVMSTDTIEVVSCLLKHKVEKPCHFPVRVITAPAALNPNLRAQEGVFTLHQASRNADGGIVDRRPLEVQACENLTQIKELSFQVFRRVTLPCSEAGKLLWILASFGVSAASLFPDYRGSAKAVQEENMRKRPKWDAR